MPSIYLYLAIPPISLHRLQVCVQVSLLKISIAPLPVDDGSRLHFVKVKNFEHCPT